MTGYLKNGFIHEGVKTAYALASILPAIGFPEKEEGARQYEMGFQMKSLEDSSDEWVNCTENQYKHRGTMSRRIVAIPLPDKQSGEKEHKEDIPANKKYPMPPGIPKGDYGPKEGETSLPPDEDLYAMEMEAHKQESEEARIKQFLIDNRIIRADQQEALIEVIAAYVKQRQKDTVEREAIYAPLTRREVEQIIKDSFRAGRKSNSVNWASASNPDLEHLIKSITDKYFKNQSGISAGELK